MSYTFQPIGTIKTSYQKKYDAPRQPGVESATSGIITLLPHQNFEYALHDLQGFSHIWVIYVFHQNSAWKPKVLPPRKTREKKGLFATRSPHRPNPIGMSVVKLNKISGRKLWIEDHDLLDETPILDIKPYLTYADSHPDATQGWINDLVEHPFEISYQNDTLQKLNWLLAENIAFFFMISRPCRRFPAG